VNGTLSPSFVMTALAAGAALCLSLLAVLSPDALGLLKGEPLEPVSRSRLNFLRAALAPFGLAALGFCVRHRRATTWWPLQALIFAVPFAAVVVVALYKLRFGGWDPRYMTFVREDGPVEYATAVVFLVGSAVAARAALLGRDPQTRICLWLFSAAMLFVALSEVSFGQRIIGIETPEPLAAINSQDEITVHNIFGIDLFLYFVVPHLILAYAIFGPAILARVERSGAGRRLSPELLAVARVPWYAVGYFVPMALFSAKQWIDYRANFKDQEPSELFLAVGFVLVAINAWLLLRRTDVPQAPERSRSVPPSAGQPR
jgi:hypothetical protein